ncbi:MAG TPA: lasso peptide biosynthesis B2 protein [Caulobacteraceae bacterium]|jgi:hypothetical protein
MQTLFLRPGIYVAALGDDLVSLDIDAGDYSCLLGVGGAVPPSGQDGRIDLAEDEVAELLLEARIAASQPGGDARVDLPPRAIASCWRTENALITVKDQRRFVRAYLSAAPRFWRAHFSGLLAAARCARCGGPQDPTTALRHDAQVFDQLSPFAPFHGECLFRAFVLLAYLRLEGRDATWVFGVRTYPFQAHCWLQVGDVVLNDAVERICAYTPILAV